MDNAEQAELDSFKELLWPILQRFLELNLLSGNENLLKVCQHALTLPKITRKDARGDARGE